MAAINAYLRTENQLLKEKFGNSPSGQNTPPTMNVND
jgi:hypothetical protein